MTYVTRFAPSPTGPLHLGHAFSAVTAHRRAQAANGQFLVRIDDIDSDRCRPEWEAQALDDLAWLGLSWPEPVWRQSQSLATYDAALRKLSAQGLTYPCRCSRRDIAEAAGAPQEGAPHHGPDGRLYPGTCRGRAMNEKNSNDAIRLDMAKAVARLKGNPGFRDTGPIREGHHILAADCIVREIGDVVIARRFGGVAYHLAVVIDDAAQGVTEVTRGDDLFDATFIHVLLQHLLDLPTPHYHHHALIRDDTGKRLAKRDDARAISTYRADGASPTDVLEMVGL